MTRFDFANILLSGACNLRCPACIGRRLPESLAVSNLDRFPLRGLARFTRLLQRHGVDQLTVTGTNTDPLLYAHQRELLSYLRRQVPGVTISLHTNGVLALQLARTLNRYDKVTISLPSFRERTCLRMTGRARVLDLERIIAIARIPIKVSTLVTAHNRAEIDEIIARCQDLGVRRLVLRKPYGARGPLDVLAGRVPSKEFAGQPVFQIGELELTIWDFSRSTLRCLNLFADGTIGGEYELTRNAAREARG